MFRSLTRQIIPLVFQQAALVLNASRRFRYTLDLKKEEEKKRVLRIVIVHTRAIQVRFFNWLSLLFLMLHVLSELIN